MKESVEMKKLLGKVIGCLLPGMLIFNGCTADISAIQQTGSVIRTADVALPFNMDVDASTMEISFLVNGQSIPVSNGFETQKVEGYSEKNDVISWTYPEEEMEVQLTKKENYLEVKITSLAETDHSFVWPSISADEYYLPLGEGKRVPANDTAWIDYLDQQQVSALEQLSMPFWISRYEGYDVLFIMENPYRTELNFTAQPDLSFSVSHRYPEIDPEKTNTYRIYVTEDNPVYGAKIYRNYVKEKGDFVTLAEKAEQNLNIEKLYGAPFVYLWGENIISENDINWEKFRQSTDHVIMKYLCSFSSKVENGAEFEKVLQELKNQDYVADYQKNTVCSYISQLLRSDDFWNPMVFTQKTAQMNELLCTEYDSLTDSQKIQLNKEALAANMPGVFQPASTWMNASTVDLLKDMQESGIDAAWIGLNSWEQAYAKPELVEQANDMGYLIASYDSYHSIHAPGQEQWITAAFDDASLYENATVTDKNGEKESGFQNVGRKLNPTLSMPAVESRMKNIMSNDLPFNSWFIDCDVTGEIYDDYTPEHITTQEQDLSARLERMAYIRDAYDLVVGSEGGNDFAASTIAYAHGIELPSFSWMDQDMKANEESEYFIGKYYNPTGGVAEHFAKRIPIKEQYDTIFVNSQYDIPLFKLVYNDSVITSAHWDWSTFKIEGKTQDRMIREVLYNVSPLYHLDDEQWNEYKEDITAHNKIWSAFSKKAVQNEMTDFSYLNEDGTVQKTVYGNQLSVVANFGDTSYNHEGTEIPAHSAFITESGKSMVYTPILKDTHK